jgi:hypothetical protein
MSAVNLFGVSYFGKSTNVTSQERVNCYMEFQPGDDKSRVAIYGTPGLQLFASFGDTPIRGMYVRDDLLYVVHRGTLWSVNNAGVKTSLGTIGTTSGRVYMADNGAMLMLTDGSAGYTYTYATTTFATIVDADYPGAGTNTWLEGFFVVNKPDTQRFYVSAINDASSWDALDFASAESNPDDLVRVFADNGKLYLLGKISSEIWVNAGEQDFPFVKISGASIEYGCAAPASVCKYDNSIAFLASNPAGDVFVARMSQGIPERLSTPELEYVINRYGAVSDATAYSYMIDGHPMYIINFPTGGQTWMFDGLSKLWSRLEGNGITRHRAEIGLEFINRIVVSDYENGNLYRLSADAYTDNGSPIALEIITRHVSSEDKDLIIDSLELDMEYGVGLATGQGVDPQIMLSVSRDGGHTYGNEVWKSFGRVGLYKQRAVWRRLGSAYDWTFKWRITDPVKRVITAPAYIKARSGLR